ncbi:DNA internalization-related competence protein ComEC/Rec2 [Anaerotignum sp.]
MRAGKSEVVCLASFLLILFLVSQSVIKHHNWKSILFLLFSAVGFLAAGNSLEKNTADTFLLGMTEGTGVIREEGLTSSGNQKLTVHCDLEDESGETLQDQKLYVIWSGEEPFEVGEIVSFIGDLRPFYEASVPGGYDEDLYLRTREFDGKMYPEEMTKLGEDGSVVSSLARARANVQKTLDDILPVNESGIMKAMLTGDKDDIPEESYEMYARVGVVHVLCISGLHMSILALYVSFFTEKILKRSRRFSAVVTMAAALCFLAFIGFTPSAVRAVTMICVVMTARVLFRSHERLNEIAIAALLILFVEPLYLFHIGFQLSFITVLGLCLAAEHLHLNRKKDRTWKEWLKDSLCFSLYASLFSFPMVAYYFYTVSLVGILANLVIIPLSGILLGFGILSALLGMLWMPLGVFAAGSVYGILQVFEGICTALLKLPFACILVGSPSEMVILLGYSLLFFWMYFAGKKGSWKGAALLCAVLFCAVFENQLFRKEITVTFLDVGQGDAAVIHTWDKKTYLVDGGGAYGKAFGENVGKTVLLPYLEYLGVSEVDTAFLSHPDSDHMTGLLEILEDIPVKALYLGNYPYTVTKEMEFLKESVEKYPTTLYTVDNREHSLDGAWTCLAPVPGILYPDGDDNCGSVVLKYRVGETEILFTGDMTAENERLLLESDADVSADILKVSHHGSKYSSTQNFLAEVAAKAAVISCGENNIYGHPHEKTMERMENAGAKIYRTDVCGSVQVKMKRDGTFTIETMTERKPLYENIKKRVEKW